ncbi:hypothetical protein VNO80_22947 [Phaseolus coccineus]|uniref:Uncharacterized protein n=1 Tax=Phaseolus coccineus TaxID=3886 RepID=A0AAN9QUI8_PHACN
MSKSGALDSGAAIQKFKNGEKISILGCVKGPIRSKLIKQDLAANHHSKTPLRCLIFPKIEKQGKELSTEL